MFPLCLVVFPSRVSEASSPYRIRRRQPIRKAPRAPPRLRPTVMHPVRQSHACPYFPAPPPDELPLLPIPEELLLVEPRVLGRLKVDPLIPLEFWPLPMLELPVPELLPDSGRPVSPVGLPDPPLFIPLGCEPLFMPGLPVPEPAIPLPVPLPELWACTCPPMRPRVSSTIRHNCVGDIEMSFLKYDCTATAFSVLDCRNKYTWRTRNPLGPNLGLVAAPWFDGPLPVATPIRANWISQRRPARDELPHTHVKALARVFTRPRGAHHCYYARYQFARLSIVLLCSGGDYQLWQPSPRGQSEVAGGRRLDLSPFGMLWYWASWC